MKTRLQGVWSSVEVKSCADGSMHLHPKWLGVPEYTPEDGGGPGLLDRLTAAEILERELNAMLRTMRKR